MGKIQNDDGYRTYGYDEEKPGIGVIHRRVS